MFVDAAGPGRAGWRTGLAALALLLMAVVRPAVADLAAAPRFVDPSLAWLGGGVPGPAAAWRIAAAGAMSDTLCASGKPLAGWLALAPAVPTAVDCRPVRSLRVAVQPVGRQVGVFVTAPGAAPVRLSAATLHRAVGAGADARPTTWRAVDAGLPDMPIAVLLPAAGTAEWQLLSAAALQAGCLAQPAVRRIFDAGERKARCEALRTDGAVERRTPGVEVAGWLAAKGAGAVAFVSYPEFLALGDAVLPIAFDDSLPTLAAIAADRYPVSRTIHLSVALAEPTDPALLRDALRLAGEATIGPAGTLVGLGVVPLPAAARVQVRETLLSLGGAL